MLTDKAWSNWKSSGRNASETLIVTLPAERDVTRVVVHFYPDNASGGGRAESARAGVPATDGSCAGRENQVIGDKSDLSMEARTDKICVTLTATPDGYLTVAELEVIAKTAE